MNKTLTGKRIKGNDNFFIKVHLLFSNHLPDFEDFSILTTNRGSHRRCSVKRGVLKNFLKVVGLRPATLLKQRLQHGCFPVNVAKCLRTPFYGTTLSNCFYTSNNDFKVTFMESLLINGDHPPLNKNKQSSPLELFDN